MISAVSSDVKTPPSTRLSIDGIGASCHGGGQWTNTPLSITAVWPVIVSERQNCMICRAMSASAVVVPSTARLARRRRDGGIDRLQARHRGDGDDAAAGGCAQMRGGGPRHGRGVDQDVEPARRADCLPHRLATPLPPRLAEGVERCADGVIGDGSSVPDALHDGVRPTTVPRRSGLAFWPSHQPRGRRGGGLCGPSPGHRDAREAS